jgi:hypothetical protein
MYGREARGDRSPVGRNARTQCPQFQDCWPMRRVPPCPCDADIRLPPCVRVDPSADSLITWPAQRWR